MTYLVVQMSSLIEIQYALHRAAGTVESPEPPPIIIKDAAAWTSDTVGSSIDELGQGMARLEVIKAVEQPPMVSYLGYPMP